MPYIKTRERDRLSDVAEHIQNTQIETAGNLQYLIAKLIRSFLLYKNPINYQVLNDVIGALEGAKQEFYRRKVVPYEESKIRDNGDVY